MVLIEETEVLTTVDEEVRLEKGQLISVQIRHVNNFPIEATLVVPRKREIGFVESRPAHPELLAGIEAYRAGKLKKDDA